VSYPSPPSRRTVAVGAFGVVATAAWSAPKPGFPTMATLSGRMPCGACAEPAGVSWRTTITPPGEPGQPLQISGVIYRPDRRTPAPGVTLFVFHTDASGRYNPQVSGYAGETNPRLRGWMRTGADGRYQFRTIKPGQYSGPVHIHAHLYAAGRPEWFIREYLFAGDPLIPQADRAEFARMGRYSPMVTLARSPNGLLTGERDLLLTDDPHRPWPPAK